LILDSIIRIYASDIDPLSGLHQCVIPKLCRVWPQGVISQSHTR